MANGAAWQQGWDTGLKLEEGRKEHKRSRQEQLQDEQRNDKLAVYANLFQDNRISQGEMAHAIEDIYHDAAPEKKMSILGRVLNRNKAKRQHQDFLEGRQKSASEEQGILAGAKTPEQVKAEAYKSQNQSQIDADLAKKKAAIASLPALFPEATPDQLSEIKERILAPGAVHRPTVDEMKREDYKAALQGGYQGSYEQWVAQQAAQGRGAGSPEKPPSMKAGVAGGKNVFAYYSPKQGGWVDSTSGGVLKDFRPTPTFAQMGLYEPVLTYNPQSGQLLSGIFNRRTGATQVKPLTSGGPLAAPVAKELSTNIQPAVESDTRLKIMEENERAALQGDQQAMLSLVSNHIGMTLGQQKGAHINQAVWNEAVESTPFLARAAAKWGPDGFLSGVTLAPQQIHQMVELAKLRREQQWQQAEQAAGVYGVSLNVPEFSRSETPKAPAPKKPESKNKASSTIVVTPEDMK